MYKIYGLPISVHTRKVIVCAIEKQIPFEIVPVVPMEPPPGFTDLSPLGKIPAIAEVDGGDAVLKLADSSVICAYLERKHPEPAFYPTDAKAYGHALWIEEYVDGALSQDVLAGFFQKIIRPAMLGEDPDPVVIKEAIENSLPPKLDYAESLIGSGFLVGDRFGIADVTLASSMINYLYAGFPLDDKRYPKLTAYLKRLAKVPSVRRALDIEAQVVKDMSLDGSFFDA